MKRTIPIILCCCLFLGIKCEDSPPPKSGTDTVKAELQHSSLPVGTSFRATIDAEAKTPRFLSKQKAKRMGQYRAVETRTAVNTTFYAELKATEPERWRLDFESFTRTTQTMGAEEATSTHSIPDMAFFVEFTDPPSVTDEHGGDVTESQAEYTIGVANVLRERHAWGEYIVTREFSQGKIVEAAKGLVLGRFAESMFGPISDPHTTVAFFRFGQDAAKNELAIFDVHSRFKAVEPEMSDGSYFDFEAKGRASMRISDAFLTGYDVSAKVTPRAKTGEMLPEGSGSWRVDFDIDAATLQSP